MHLGSMTRRPSGARVDTDTDVGQLVWGLLFVWPCYLCVAEMVAWLPVRGNIFELAARYVDPALGFGMVRKRPGTRFHHIAGD